MGQKIPSGAPKDPDLSIEDLAKNFDIAGGNIISTSYQRMYYRFHATRTRRDATYR